MAANKKPIQYFVFMKAETTGRQWEDGEPTRIVELSLIAMNRIDLKRGMPKAMPAASKLNMVFWPERGIQEEATASHDLTVNYVQNALTFEQGGNSIVTFLQHLPKPVCLVAYNGNSFDYKHLKGECNNAGISLPEDLLCVDAMWLFYYILKNDPNYSITRAVTLPILYKTLFNESLLLTTAEEKALAILDCALLKKEFLTWADKRYKLFSDVLPVGGRRPLMKRKCSSY